MATKKQEAPRKQVKKVVKRRDRKRDYAIKNKVGNRENGRPVRSIETKELVGFMEKLMKGGELHKRDRNIIARELYRRNVEV